MSPRSPHTPSSTSASPSSSPSTAAMTTYTHQNHPVPLARSNSFFGTIKNIVTAPFAWFASSEDEFEDAKGKRRRLQTIPEDTQMEDEGLPSRAKRMRVDTPDRDTQPYLDPPRSAFAQPRRLSDHSRSSSVRDITRSPRKTLNIPSSPHRLLHNRRTVSPLPSTSHFKPLGVTRTMSLDPPSNSSFSSRIQAASSTIDVNSELNLNGHSKSVSRDVSMSPRHLRVRSSLTPQPSGSGFGPVVPPRRERAPDEPPPLTALMSNPMFVKPPPAAQKQGTTEPQKQLTLGTLLDSQRTARPLARQSSILFGTGSMTDVSARHFWPVNKAEVALQELEVYKTPLLPTRLKGATAVPDMFLHKGKKHITLMTDDRPAKPRLGTKSKSREKGKQKERETTNGTKPYAGEGGMKKWLARRRREEEEAKEKEKAEAMEDERAEEETKRKEAEAEKRREAELKVPPPPAPAFEPRVSREGPLSSSLRVGRTRTGRNHIDRPMSRRAKFSAAFEDEDEDMEESRATEQKALEEAAKKAPVFEIPTGFTFAKETTMKHDLSDAKEPPMTSLPFSLTKPTPANPSTDTVKAAPASAPAPAPTPAPPAPIPAQPTILLVPPTPETAEAASEESTLPAKVAPVPSTASAGVPNFFAGSSIFAKSTVITTPSSSFLAAPGRSTDAPKLDAPKSVDTTPLVFGGPSKPISLFAPPASDSVPASAFGEPLALPKETEKLTTATSSQAPPFTFGISAKPVESVPVSTSSPPSKESQTAESTQPAALLNGAPTTFGAPPPIALSPTPAETAAPAIPATSSATTAEPPKSVFTFGRPTTVTSSTSAPASVIVPPTPEGPKSLFGIPPPATPFSFGQHSGTVPVEEKSAANQFSFETSTAEKKPTTSFSFSSSATSTAAPAAPTPFNFGATPSGTTAADISSKPFAFGSPAPSRPVTPPKVVQEVSMDESPARDMVINGSGNSKAPERPTLNFSFGTPSGSALFAQSPATATAPFSFGTSGSGTAANPFAKEEKKETKPVVSFGGFGQAPSAGFSFGQKPPESPAATTTAPTPFSFGQPSPSVAPPSPFPFGAPPTSAAPFGGQPATISAPSSPSTFNRPASFTFGTPATTQPAASPFAFGAGSQPASPATGSTTLPSGTAGAPFTFGAGANAAATQAGGFGATTPSAVPAGGSLFTMGSAPPPMEGAGGRRIKGLPRRGARR